MRANRRIALLAVVFTVVIGSALVAGGAFAAVTNTGTAASSLGSLTPAHSRQGWPGNVTGPRQCGCATGPPQFGNATRPPWPENVTRPFWSGNVTVTSEQAKTIASDAVKAFIVGEVRDSGNLWMVSIKYNDTVAMIVLLGKLNTPTSGDALKAVQDSIGKGWTAGEPKQLGFTYNVPIIDANGNPIGNIRIDGRTGGIIAGFPPLHG